MSLLSSHSTLTQKRKFIPWIILLVGLIHGLIYVFFVPWWEHYDEPGHFEYAWLAANQSSWPKVGDYNQEMRLKVDATLETSGFFIDRMKVTPNLSDPTKELWIGYSQVGDSPFYYCLVAIPLRLLKTTSIPVQLYAGRLVSLLFYLLTIWAGIKFAAELVPVESPLRWMLPLFLALLPGLAEFMTALNNHTAAIGVGSIWIWLSVRLIRRGARWVEILALTLITILCYFTQQNVWITIPLFPLVLLLTFTRNMRWAIALFFAAVIAITIPLIFGYDDAAMWIRRNYQDFATHTEQSLAPYSNNAIKLKLHPDQNWGVADPNWHAGIYQLVPYNIDALLRGNTVTIGAWVWSDRPVTVYGPGLNSRKNNQDIWFGFVPVNVETQPKFTAFHAKIPKKGNQLQLWLRATTPSELSSPANVYYSGIVLVEGSRPVNVLPEFTNPDGSQGIWGGQPFDNLARNALATTKWPNVNSWISKVQEVSFFDINPSSLPSIVSLVLDYPATGWYTKSSSATLLRSFWAKFAWGQINLAPVAGILAHPYRVLFLLTLLGGLGFVLSLIQNRETVLWTEVLFLLFYTSLVIIITYVYGTLTMGGSFRFEPRLPVARYIYPAILPISYFLLSGWLYFYQLIPIKGKTMNRLASALFIIFLLSLDVYAFYSQIIFYSR